MRHLARLACTALLISATLVAFAGCGDDDLPDSGIGGTGGAAAEPLPGGRPGGVGDRCESNADCTSRVCLRADDTRNSLTRGTPPNGLCTLPCESDAECASYEANTVCVGFTSRAAYCVPTCMFGAPAEDENKCFQRPELSCQPLFDETGIACERSLDCPEPYYCVDGQCSVLPVCLPRCGSDADCPDERTCDLHLGECVTTAPTGKALGESCDPDASSDECRGVCLPLEEEGKGECFEFCSVGAVGGCGFDDQRNAPVRCAGGLNLGLPIGEFDDGVCATVCRCTADCPGEQKCFAGRGEDAFCAATLPGDAIAECPADGEGGAGGGGP